MRTLDTAQAQPFATYVERRAAALGHRDRHEPLRAYVTGLCLPGDRKSIEPMAARVDPRHVRARHQSMHHFVADAPWDGAAVLRGARARRRRRAVAVPDAVPFQPKWQIALGQLRALQAEGLPPAPVVADAGYGGTTEVRGALNPAGSPSAAG